MIGTGENHNHMCYVSDAVEGLRRCSEIQGIEGQTYIITGQEPIRLQQLKELIAQELGIDGSRGSVPAAPFRAFHTFADAVYKYCGFQLPHAHRYELYLTDRVFDITKARQELAYHPQVSMKEGIHQTVKWYRENGYLK